MSWFTGCEGDHREEGAARALQHLGVSVEGYDEGLPLVLRLDISHF